MHVVVIDVKLDAVGEAVPITAVRSLNGLMWRCRPAPPSPPALGVSTSFPRAGMDWGRDAPITCNPPGCASTAPRFLRLQAVVTHFDGEIEDASELPAWRSHRVD
jgi:hypothetical protein